MRLYLGVATDGKTVDVSFLNGTKDKIGVRTIPELLAAIDQLAESAEVSTEDLLNDGFVASSSMDWPEDWTSDKELLEFIESIMN